MKFKMGDRLNCIVNDGFRFSVRLKNGISGDREIRVGEEFIITEVASSNYCRLRHLPNGYIIWLPKDAINLRFKLKEPMHYSRKLLK